MKVFIKKENEISGKNNFVSRMQNHLIKTGINVTNNINEDHDVSLHLVYVNNNVKSKKILRLDGVNHNISIKDYRQWNEGISNSIHLSDGVIYQTEFGKKMCDKYLVKGKLFRIINNGAPVDFYKNIQPAYSDYKYNFISVSRWRPHKRLRDTIESFLKLNNPSTCLWIAGDIAQSGLIEEEIEKYKNIENIVFLGILNEKDLGSYYNLCDASIHLCWIDCCPNTVVESIVAECPVITNNVGGTKELIQKTNGGIICDIDEEYDMNPIELYKPPSFDYTKVADQLENILTNKIEIDNSHLDIKNITFEYIDFFREVLRYK